MTKDTQGGLAVVTGASSGIGYELAVQFVEHGYDTVLVARSARVEDAAARLAGKGPSVLAIRVDLTTLDGVQDLMTQLRRLARPVDVIALNAGIGASGAFTDTALSDELDVIDLNVRCTVALAKAIIPDMVRRGSGRVLFTSSVAANIPGSFSAVYNASKSFIQSFAQAIRNELKDSGVTVTSLMPGATETDFFRRANEENTKVGQSEKDDPAEVARQGYEALMEGKDHVVAGSFTNKLQNVAAHILPDPVMAEMHRKQAEPLPKTR